MLTGSDSRSEEITGQNKSFIETDGSCPNCFNSMGTQIQLFAAACEIFVGDESVKMPEESSGMK